MQKIMVKKTFRGIPEFVVMYSEEYKKTKRKETF